MIKSNILKTKDHIYPPEFTDEDKLEYDKLHAEAEVIHKAVFDNEPWIIRLSIIGHIRAKKGMKEPYTNEELIELKNKYTLTTREFTCDSNANPDLYEKNINPIFFPHAFFGSLSNINSNIIVENE